MSSLDSNRMFTGGMDADSDPKFVKKENYVKAVNLWDEVMASAKVGDMVRLNTLLSNYSYNLVYDPAILDMVPVMPQSMAAVGSCTDGTNIFIFRSDGSILIMSLISSETTVEPVFFFIAKGTLFQTQINSLIPITSCFVKTVNAVPTPLTLLYWIDQYRIPRRLNVARALHLVDNGPTTPLEGHMTFDDSATKLAVAPHHTSPTWAWRANGLAPVNALNGNTFRFYVQYEYVSGERTRFSPSSVPARHSITSREFSKPQRTLCVGLFINVDVPYNEIAVSFNSGGQDVAKARLGVRVNDGPMEQFAVVDVLEFIDTQLTEIFDNKTEKITQPDYMYLENFSAVSKRANQIVSLEGGARDSDVIVIGGDVEAGYDRVESIDVGIDTVNVEGRSGYGLSSFSGAPDGSGNAIISVPIVSSGEHLCFFIKDDTFKGTLIYATTRTPEDVANGIEAFHQRAADEINLLPNAPQVTLNYVGLSYQGTWTVAVGVAPNNLEVFLTVHDKDTDVLANNPDDVTAYGIVYYDDAGAELLYTEGFNVIGNDRFIVKIGENTFHSPYTVDSAPDGLVILPRYYRPQFHINHIPPIWAVSYQIVAAYGLLKIRDVRYLVTEVIETTIDEYRVGLKINRNILLSDDNNIIKDDFLPSSGDFVKDLRSHRVYKVLSYDEAISVVYIQSFDLDWIIHLAINATFDIEIFSLKNNAQTQIYTEIGPALPIINIGLEDRGHAGTFVNQIFGVQPAIVDFSNGDIRVLDRNTHSQYYNRTQSEIIPIAQLYGRAHIYDPDAALTINKARYRWSDRFFENGLNGYSSFRALNYNDLATNDGSIYWIGITGYRFKIFQENRITTAYIGRTITTDGGGDESSVLLTTDLFGTIRASEMVTGTIHPGSVQIADGQIFYWDQRRKGFYRDDVNGPGRISEGIENYSRKIFEFLDSDQNLSESVRKISSVFSHMHDMYLVYVYSQTPSAPFTDDPLFRTSLFQEGALALRKASGVWRGFIGYRGDCYVESSLGIFYFNQHGGVLAQEGVRGYAGLSLEKNLPWMDMDGNDVNGEPASVTISINDYPDITKLFQAIQIYGLGEWFADNSDGNAITAPPSNNHPEGMRSRLKANRWKNIEGKRAASFLRDMNDPRFTEEVKALLNGRFLKGECLIVELSILDTSKGCHINQVKASFIPSKKT